MYLHIIPRAVAKSLGMKRFFTGLPCKRGHYSERLTSSPACIACQSGYGRDYQKANMHKWAAYRSANREQLAARAREYRRENREAISRKDVARKRDKRQSDPLYAEIHRLRALVSASLAGKGFKKNSNTAEILGCSWADFRRHIERQFLKGMSWENRHLWHVDHITPMATAKTVDVAIALNHFTNLRPLWIEDNLSKGGKILNLL